MGDITSISVGDEKVKVSLELSKKEYLDLNGRYNDIICLTRDQVDENSKISSRGKGATSKYFLVPKKLREGINHTASVKCKKIELSDSYLMVYLIPK